MADYMKIAGGIGQFIGASTDTKPTTDAPTGSRCYEYDTNKWYITSDAGTTWVEMQDLNALILGAGTAIVGKVGIDQTTPGTTNNVAMTGMGEVQASPTPYTLLARVKDLITGIVLAAGTAIIGRVLPPATVETPFTGASSVVVGTHKITPGAAFKLTEIELHLNAAPTTGTQNLVITKDDGVNIVYDAVILTIDLVANAVTDLRIKPDLACKATDVITAAWANTDSKTFGLIFKHQLL